MFAVFVFVCLVCAVCAGRSQPPPAREYFSNESLAILGTSRERDHAAAGAFIRQFVKIAAMNSTGKPLRDIKNLATHFRVAADELAHNILHSDLEITPTLEKELAAFTRADVAFYASNIVGVVSSNMLPDDDKDRTRIGQFFRSAIISKLLAEENSARGRRRIVLFMSGCLRVAHSISVIMEFAKTIPENVASRYMTHRSNLGLL